MESSNILLDDVDLGKAILTALTIAFPDSGQARAARMRLPGPRMNTLAVPEQIEIIPAHETRYHLTH
jgi:hypothetical protein